MTLIYINKDTGTHTLKLAEEFEKHYGERIQAEPGVDRRVVFEDWANQKVPLFQQGIFKIFSPVAE